jgi:hypothetical protein
MGTGYSRQDATQNAPVREAETEVGGTHLTGISVHFPCMSTGAVVLGALVLIFFAVRWCKKRKQRKQRDWRRGYGRRDVFAGGRPDHLELGCVDHLPDRYADPYLRGRQRALMGAHFQPSLDDRVSSVSDLYAQLEAPLQAVQAAQRAARSAAAQVHGAASKARGKLDDLEI